MRILDRLVTRSFLKLFLVSVLATPPLFILGELTEQIDTFLERGVTGTEMAVAYLYKVPQYVVWSFPIAALIAAIFTIHGMTDHREIVAAKAGGISFHRLIAPILVMGLLLTGTGLLLTDVAPRSMKVATAMLSGEDVGQRWRNDFVFQTEDGWMLEARRVQAEEGTLREPIVERPPARGRPLLHIEAQSARWDSAVGWTFENGWHRSVAGSDRPFVFEFERYRIPTLTETPEDLLESVPEDEEMTYDEITRMIGMIERSGGQPHKLKVKKEQKISIPVATLVIILFGAPLATTSKRGGAAFGVGVALGTTILYMVLLRVAGGFGYSGTLSPLWAAWLPNIVFLLAGLVLLSRVRT